MKNVSLLAGFLLLSVVSFSQEPAKFGLKAGVNLASLDIENQANNTDMRTSFHIGGLAHIHLGPEWALQPEVVYSGQGAEVGDTHIKLDYINVPVMIQYMFNNGFRLEAGPQLGFMVGAKSEANDRETDIKESYKSVDFGLGFGLSYLSYSGFGVGARYNLGLSNINEAAAPDIKNRVIQLGVFYLFDHHHKAKSR